MDIKLIRHSLQEKHAEYIFFVFRGIHLSTQDIRRGKKVLLKLRKGKFTMFHIGLFTLSKHQIINVWLQFRLNCIKN